MLKIGVAPKFHEPSTGPMKSSNRISDVTYEVHDMSKQNYNKIVNFDRFRKAEMKHRRDVLSESMPEELITRKSNSDSLSPPQATLILHKRSKLNTPGLAEKKAKSVKPQTPELANRVEKMKL